MVPNGAPRLVLGPRASWPDIVREGEVVADGWAADSIGAPGNRLYVNRGIGFSTVSVRIDCRPDLTWSPFARPRGRSPSGDEVTVQVTSWADDCMF